MIKKIKKALGCKTNRELALLLDVAESTVSRWDKKGFHRSTERLLLLLLNQINKGET
jgi:transcriptional regulator with XRE-family HTH domain